MDTVSKGKNYFSQELLLSLISDFKSDQNYGDEKLSRREIEVLKLVCEGLSTSEIAEAMYISNRTVESHRANILSKTSAKNSIQLVVFAIRNGIYKID